MIIQPDKTTTLPEPWYWTDPDLSDQLKIEISADHPLYGKSVKTIARREDKDDVLFELSDGKYAIIHLTWQQVAHPDKRWPITKIFNNWYEVKDQILMDAQNF